MCRLGAVGWGAHSPRGSSHYNGTAAATAAASAAAGVLDAAGVVIVAADIVTGKGSRTAAGCYNDRSTFHAATVTLSWK